MRKEHTTTMTSFRRLVVRRHFTQVVVVLFLGSKSKPNTSNRLYRSSIANALLFVAAAVAAAAAAGTVAMALLLEVADLEDVTHAFFCCFWSFIFVFCICTLYCRR